MFSTIRPGESLDASPREPAIFEAATPATPVSAKRDRNARLPIFRSRNSLAISLIGPSGKSIRSSRVPQDIHNFGVASLFGGLESRPAVRSALIHLCAGKKERSHDLGIAKARRLEEREIPVLRGEIWIGARLEEDGRFGGAAPGAGEEQRGASAAVPPP